MKLPADAKIMKCEDAVKCIFNFNELDLIIYKELRKRGDMRADELAKILKKERSTVYRSLQKLTKCGICNKKTQNLKLGGYYHKYCCCDTTNIMQTAEKCLDDWYILIKKALAELKE